MFKQNLEDFLSSKTNWIGIITMVGATIALTQGQIQIMEFISLSTPMLAAMGIRDRIN